MAILVAPVLLVFSRVLAPFTYFAEASAAESRVGSDCARATEAEDIRRKS